MRRLAAAFVLFLACGCPKEEAPAPRSAAPAAPKIDWKSAIQHEVRWDDTRGSVVVDVTVKPGFHAYTTGEETGRPLKLEVEAPAKLADVSYPKGETKMLPIGKSVIVEGKVEVVGKVEDAGPKVDGTFHYQVCRDDGCDRPRRAKFSVSRP